MVQGVVNKHSSNQLKVEHVQQIEWKLASLIGQSRPMFHNLFNLGWEQYYNTTMLRE
jgi:hypothetical protein